MQFTYEPDGNTIDHDFRGTPGVVGEFTCFFPFHFLDVKRGKEIFNDSFDVKKIDISLLCLMPTVDLSFARHQKAQFHGFIRKDLIFLRDKHSAGFEDLDLIIKSQILPGRMQCSRKEFTPQMAAFIGKWIFYRNIILLVKSLLQH